MDLFIRKMKISIYVLGFALFKLDIYTKGQSLYISNNETSWAKVNCNLAIPNLTFTEFGLLPKHVQNITNDDLKKGCNKINADSILVKAKDLSECRWKTGCDTIAVRRFNDETIECQCGNSSDLQHEHECTSRCGSGDEYPCGDSGKAHFAIYTVENVRRMTMMLIEVVLNFVQMDPRSLFGGNAIKSSTGDLKFYAAIDLQQE
ncbi:hypothetical protein MAR_019699 [Mya arenaria]|uniref:WSC domain-containing protein n=1 Tax=Mya arenaria TaxID=6604 RepID=A0ABY7E5W3_MYAAR|nr:hypothetical protein MAR_019699 [Mya arenaria]